MLMKVTVKGVCIITEFEFVSIPSQYAVFFLFFCGSLFFCVVLGLLNMAGRSFSETPSLLAEYA